MESERAFLASATTGMTAAVGFSFAILLFATGNIVLSLLAITCVAIVILSVVAIMVFQGWELGVSESIAVVIMIGLAVDYVVHLAADYKHSVKSTRHEKIQQAYAEMGVSILSGTVTTLGCGISLFGGKLVTFQKFAVIITATISISFVSAMLLFGSLCHVVGPQGNFGDICWCFTTKSSQSDESGTPESHEMQQLPQDSPEKLD
jgi:predicted RND superfamily exporter protein